VHEPDERTPDNGPSENELHDNAGPADAGQIPTDPLPEGRAASDGGESPDTGQPSGSLTTEGDGVPENFSVAQDAGPAAGSPGEDQTGHREVADQETWKDAESESMDSSSEDDDDLPEDQELTPELVEDEAIRGDFMIRWAVILLAFLFGIREVNQTETLVHVRSGEAIRANGFWPPAQDVFSYTASERIWVNSGWLSDLLLSLIYDISGAAGLSLLTGLLAAVTFWLLSLISRQGVPTWWGSVCGAVALLAAHLQFAALPAMVTLLGIVWVMRNMIRWTETGDRQSVWCVPVSLAVWANLDSRAWLGAVFVMLYVAGAGLSRVLRSTDGGEGRGAATQASQSDLLLIAGGSLLALIVNPFGWRALFAPVFFYRAELPAMRYYIANATEPVRLQILGLLDPDIWKLLNHHFVSGLVILMTALLLSAVRGRKLDAGFVLAILAGGVGCLFCLLNLPVVALIAAAAATLAGQDWYREKCRQNYSTDRLEVLLSRGGRALTVLALASVAWLGVSGRLAGTGGAQIGIGFSPEIQLMIEGTGEDLAAAPAGEVFTLRPDHGDLLIWHRQRVFLDSRLGLYVDHAGLSSAAQGNDSESSDDFVRLHDMVRHALRVPTGELNPADPRTVWVGNRLLWQEIFDRFGVTSVAPRMWGKFPDYNTWTSLLVSPDWTLLYQGGTSALFLRTDRTGVSLSPGRFNRIDLPGLAFQEPENALGERLPATLVNLSEKLLTAQLPLQSIPLQKARHFNYYLQAAVQGVPVTQIEALSLANLSIRNANRALAERAVETSAYVELALGAAFAREVESGLVGSDSSIDISHQRYIQYIHALNMALRFRPDDLELLSQVAVEYEQAGRIDMAMKMAERCLAAIVKLPAAVDDREFASRQQLSDSMRTLVDRHREHSEAVEAELEKRLQDNESYDPLHIAATLRRDGFLLRAMRVIEEDPELIDHLESRLILAFLYSESGRLEEAASMFNVIDQMPGGMDNPLPWRLHAAWANMSLGDYDYAAAMCRKRIADITRAGDRFKGGGTELPRLQWTLVRCCLESGQCARAKEYLLELQSTSLRPLANLILAQIDPDAVPPASDARRQEARQPGGGAAPAASRKDTGSDDSQPASKPAADGKQTGE